MKWGICLKRRFFGPQGQPEFYDERYVKTRWKYNPQGNKVEEAYFDAADRPIKSRETVTQRLPMVTTCKAR